MSDLGYPFFRFLVECGFVDVQTMEEVLGQVSVSQRRSNSEEVVFCLEWLEAYRGLSQETVMRQISEWVGIAYVSRLELDYDIVAKIKGVESVDVTRSGHCVRVRCGECLWVLLVDPWSDWEGGFCGEGCEVRLTTTHEIRRWVQLLDGDVDVVEMCDCVCDSVYVQEKMDDAGVVQEGGEDVANYVEGYLAKAIRMEASDVHFEAVDEGMRIRYRLDGVMTEEVELLPVRVARVAVNQLKIMGGMSVTEKRVPQEGSGVYVLNGRQYALRYACVPTVKGESIVVRCMRDGDALMDVRGLGFREKGIDVVMETLQSSQGLVLVVGPTGSGKTTTLYAMLQELCRSGKKIVGVEDPIEVLIRGVNQVQVDEVNGVSFMSALKSFLRQSPEVIMIGEVRDQDTAQIAIQASCTGHLVLGTLHTEDALAAVVRLIDLGVDAQLLSNVLKLVIAQRLVRDCSSGGFKGRVGVFEMLQVDDALREAIRHRASVRQLRSLMGEKGFVNLWQAGLMKVSEGVTTIEELQKCMPQRRGHDV